MSNKYHPREDTLLLTDEALKLRVRRVLEIGVGSGLVTLTLAKLNDYVVGIEIDSSTIKEVLNSVRENGYGGKVDLLICDGASAFRSGIFDAVLFNPPYLPTDIGVDKTVDGGEDGIQVSERWFQDAARVVKDTGQIIFVTSSLSDYQRLLSKVESMGFHSHVVKNQHFFFEDLMVVKAVRRL